MRQQLLSGSSADNTLQPDIGTIGPSLAFVGMIVSLVVFIVIVVVVVRFVLRYQAGAALRDQRRYFMQHGSMDGYVTPDAFPTYLAERAARIPRRESNSRP